MRMSPEEYKIAFAKYNLSARALGVLLLYEIKSPEELREFCKDNKLIHLHNVGKKTCAELNRIISGDVAEQPCTIDEQIEMYRRKTANLRAKLDAADKKLAELEKIRDNKHAR